MLVRRIPPYPLVATYTVPEPNTNYIFVIEDIIEHDDLVNEVIESDANAQITISLPTEFQWYDKMYAVTIYDAVLVTSDYDRGDIVVSDNLEFNRPYVDVTKLVSTASEIKKYWDYETIARSLIDSVTGGFYFTTEYLEFNGSGTDYMPLWNHVYKIIKVWENNQLVWDRDEEPNALGQWNYLLTKDKSAIIKDPVQNVGEYIMQTGAPVGVPLSESDSYYLYDTQDSTNTFAVKPGVTFPVYNNYIFKVEWGWRVVPSDITDATNMLIDDIACGKLDYYKRYAINYSTDQFRIQFDKTLLSGTGNIIVDKILDQYKVQNFGRYGVL